jgi:predicted DNA binding CopG/RHH family protein
MAGSRSTRRIRYIKSLEEIPRFVSEATEAEFWATHSLAAIWDKLEPVRVKVSPSARRLVIRQSRKKPVTLRLEEGQVQRAKKLARDKSLSYQALMRSWITEGIAREERALKRA